MMKSRLSRFIGMFALTVLFASPPSSAATRMGAGDLGIGMMAPNPTGVTAKYWLNSEIAIAGAIGAQGKHWAGQLDLIAHLSELLPQPADGKRIPAYLGIGFKGEDLNPNRFAIRFIFGVAYHTRYEPLEFFGEIGPALRIDRNLDTEIDGGVGVRYYFTLNRKEDGLIRPPSKRRSRPRKGKKTRRRKTSKQPSSARRPGYWPAWRR